MKESLVAVVFCFFIFSSSVLAQPPDYLISQPQLPSWLRGVAFIRFITGLWYLFVLLGFSFIAISWLFVKLKKPLGAKTFFGASVLSFAIAIFACEYAFIVPLLTRQPLFDYTSCENLQELTYVDWVLCAMTGYTLGKWGGLSLATFVCMLFIVPLALLYSIFYLGVSGMFKGWVTYSNWAERIIAFCLAIFAYRGFLVSGFVEFLSLGAWGIALLVIDFILIGVGLRFLKGFLGIEKLERIILRVREVGKLERDVLASENEILKALWDARGGSGPLRRTINSYLRSESILMSEDFRHKLEQWANRLREDPAEHPNILKEIEEEARSRGIRL